jgi:hypothetical protein
MPTSKLSFLMFLGIKLYKSLSIVSNLALLRLSMSVFVIFISSFLKALASNKRHYFYFAASELASKKLCKSIIFGYKW